MYSFVVFCLNQQIGFLQLICILQRISIILLDMKSKNPVKKSTSRVFLRKEDNYNDTKASRGSINSNDDVIRKHIPCKKIRVLVFLQISNDDHSELGVYQTNSKSIALAIVSGG